MAPFLIPLVTSLAPTLVRLATGSDRAEAVAQSVSQAVERATGIAPADARRASEAQALIEADPELAARLASELRELEGRELDRLLADRRDARARDVEVRRLTGGLNTRANVMLLMAFLAIVVIAGALVVLNLRSAGQSGGELQFTGAIIGFLTGIGGMFARNIGSAFDFEFGSSRGSKNKDGHIEQLSRELSALRGEPGAAPLDAFRRRLSAGE
jgi:hypothetical protein